ncbi:MAG: extracellular solute-binding protein [Oscillospiraceae bacterium]|jgi:ABC-type glycerol-3-phosphate transport system substrate-binding protein|nr:extracellular solute-binding protein [Oscillospiraceae bacterium]
MKKLIACALAAALLLASCASDGSDGANSAPSGNSAEAGEVTAQPIGELSFGYEWAAEALDLSRGEVTAAGLADGKLLYIADGSLYSADTDGTDSSQVAGFAELPGDIQLFPRPDGTSFEQKGFITDIAEDSAGNVYFLNGSGKAEVFGSAGSPLFSAESVGWSGGLLEASGAEPLVYSLSQNPGGIPLYEFDLKAKAIGKSPFRSVSVPDTLSWRSFVLYGEDALVCTAGGITLLNLKTSETTDIVSFTDVALSDSTRIIGVGANAEIFALSEGTLYTLSRVRKAETPKTELTLAMLTSGGWVPPQVNRDVNNFNQASSDYKIKLVTYSDRVKLNTEIISGNIPDLMVVDSPLPFDSFAAKGLFEDLNPFFDSEPEAALIPAVKRAMSSGDKLYRVTSSFSILTFAGDSAEVGAEAGWTFGEMLERASKLPDDTGILGGWGGSESREAMSEFVLGQNLDTFIDWENAEVSFDSPDFRKYLEFIKGYPSIPEGSVGNVSPPKSRFLASRYMYGMSGGLFSRYIQQDNELSGRLTFKGFPGEAKTIGVLWANSTSFAVTSACKDKAGAWAFIRSSLFAGNFEMGVSVLQSEFDKSAAEAMAQLSEDEVSTAQNGAEPRTPMTGAQLDKFTAMMNSVEHTLGSAADSVIQGIISEEAGAYYEGQKSAEEVCGIIQSRASIYVSEQS